MPVVGANQIKSNARILFTNIATKKALQFAYAVGSNAGILSKSKAPLEYGTLHNSQMFNVKLTDVSVRSYLSYNVGYARHLNGYSSVTPIWKPKNPALKKGPAWNPDSRPRFLEYGFESAEAQRGIEQYMKIFKI